MNIWTWLKSRLWKGSLSGDELKVALDDYSSVFGDVYIREMAFWSSVNLIANAISKCEFKTFHNGVEVKDEEYYLWNIEPNKNQNSSEFISKLIAQLYRKNECLVIERGRQLLVADSFTKHSYTLHDDVFTDVKVGEITFSRFEQSEVLYWQLNNEDMNRVIGGLYDSYSKLITYSMKAFQRSRGTKGIFKYDTLPPAGEQREIFDRLINEGIKKFLQSDSAALPLGSGQSWTELTKRTYSEESSRDIRHLIDDVSDFTSKGFGIPPALLRGDVEGIKDALNQFLTFCIDPLADKLQEEIIRKRSGYSGFKKGSYVKIDTSQIKHIDILSVSESIDKLISSGVFCVNDIRTLVGIPTIDEEWANAHFITKNYQPLEESMQNLGGGV